MNELALFAGAGGGILASRLLGWNTVCAVEIEEYPRKVLIKRQEEGHLDPFPIWDDVCTFDGKPWRGKIDIITGGFPCQDISAAGKGAGLAGTRSGLWFEYLRIVKEVRPSMVFAENSPNLRTRGLGTVIEGLTQLGYDVRWCVLGAWHVGANHKRNRMWVLADTGRKLWNKGCDKESGRGKKKWLQNPTYHKSGGFQFDSSIWWRFEPSVDRVANGMAHRVDRLKAIGNGQVPAVAATAFTILKNSRP